MFLGVAYISGAVTSFCTVSASHRHDPPAIWAYLLPVLRDLKETHQHLKFLHIWSDGPTTQYRNKANFWLLDHFVSSLFSSGSWNMFEAGHGKGAADAIGGVVKRSADQYVNLGHDLPNAIDLFNVLSSTLTVKMYYVAEDAIHDIDQLMPQKIQPVPGTMQLHQISLTDCRGVIKVQTLSCFCNQNPDCLCYGARNAELVKNAEQLPDEAQKPRKVSRQRVRVCKKTHSGNKRTKKRKQQTEGKAEENDSSCLICNGQECDDQEGEQWIQCNKCLRWAHELCVDVTDSQFFFCDFCV